jgi:hypothetical protein
MYIEIAPALFLFLLVGAGFSWSFARRQWKSRMLRRDVCVGQATASK